MGVRSFKTLIAIAELGTFAKAAAAVHLTPAAVSQQMKALEVELDMPLFDRSKRPPVLNPAGYALIPKALKLIKYYEELKPSLDGELETLEYLTVGTVPTITTGIMPRAIKVLQNDHDNLHIRIYPGLSEDLYAQVDRGFLDVAVMTEPPTIYKNLICRPFTEEPFVVLTSKDITLKDPMEILRTQSFIRYTRKAWVGKDIDRWLLENKIQVHETMELDTLEAIAVMVMNNLGISIVPLSCCVRLEHEHLNIVPLNDASFKRVLCVLYRHDTSKHILIELLLKKLLQVVEESGITKVLIDPPQVPAPLES
jgi:DNA-binding transcriptional LysR family regulator